MKKHTGDSAISYIHCFVIQKAKSSNHFSRLFKKKEGMSPSEYVERLR